MKKAFLFILLFVLNVAVALSDPPPVYVIGREPEAPCTPDIPEGITGVGEWKPLHELIHDQVELVELNGQWVERRVKEYRFLSFTVECDDNTTCTYRFDAYWRTNEDDYTQVEITWWEIVQDPADPCHCPLSFDVFLNYAVQVAFIKAAQYPLFPKDENGRPFDGNYYSAAIASCWHYLNQGVDVSNDEMNHVIDFPNLTPPSVNIPIPGKKSDEIQNSSQSSPGFWIKCDLSTCCYIGVCIIWEWDDIDKIWIVSQIGRIEDEVSSNSPNYTCEIVEVCEDKCNALMTFEKNCCGQLPKYGENNDIKLISAKDNRRIHPNPNSGSFTLNLQEINSENISIEIVSIEGISVYCSIIDNNEKDSIELNLPEIASGTYIYILKDGSKVLESGKFIIIK